MIASLRDGLAFAMNRYVSSSAPRFARYFDDALGRARLLSPMSMTPFALQASGEHAIRVISVGEDTRLRTDIGRRVRTAVGEVESRRLPTIVARDLGPELPALHDGDLACVLIPRSLGSRFQRAGFFLVPPWVLQAIDVTRPLDELCSSRDARRTLRDIDAEGFDAIVRRDKASFEFFYERIYRATIVARHGDQGLLREPTYLRLGLRHGAIIFIRSAGTVVAGALNVRRFASPVVDNWSGGVLDADPVWLRRHADAATYLHSIYWARSQPGCTTLGLTAARPFLNDGLFRFKRKWGAHVLAYPRSGRVLAIAFHRATTGVVSFLERNPFVARSRAGLVGIAASMTAPVEADTIWSAGLERLYVLGPYRPRAKRARVEHIACSAAELAFHLSALARGLMA
jgi:hypothetical protein